MLIDRPPSKYRFSMFMFWLMAAATQLNFNHISNMIFGTGWFFNLGLVLCSIFLILAVRIPLRRTLGLPGYLIVAALASYLMIGGGVFLITDSEWRTEPYRLPLIVCLAILVITASALGASVVLRRFGIEYLLVRILVIKAIVCILLLANPLLVEHVFHTLPEHYIDVHRTRFTGIFYGPNLAGAAACQAVVLSLALLSSRRRGFVFYLVAILCSTAVVLTFSRAAIFTLILICLFFLWSPTPNMHTGLRPYTAVRMTSIFVLGVLVLMFISLEYLPLEIKQLDRLNWMMDIDPSAVHYSRFILWPSGISYITESPLLGHGLSQFHHLEGTLICPGGPIDDFIFCGVHNTYLLLWGEAGVIPLILFLLFIGSLLRTRLTLPRSLAAATAAGWTITLAVESMATDGAPFFVWNAFIIGLTCALVTHVVREARERRMKEMLETRNQRDFGSGHAVQGGNFHGK